MTRIKYNCINLFDNVNVLILNNFALMKKIFLLIFLLAIAAKVEAQQDSLESKFKRTEEDDKSVFWKERMVYGGFVGLSATQGLTQIVVNPIAAYELVPSRVLTGVGVHYQLLTNFSIGNHFIGLAPFARFYPFGGFFVHAEMEFSTFFAGTNGLTGNSRNDFFSTPMIGAGFTNSGEIRGFYFGILIIPNWANMNTPYPSPVIPRLGIFF